MVFTQTTRSKLWWKRAVNRNLVSVNAYFPEKALAKETETKPNVENSWKYAHVPVRGKKERKLLKGFSCKECESYYKSLKLEEGEINEIMQKCSRHRENY